ncbi:hypothetical protein KR074_001590, partial [Drosophila pseudoananassae]
LEDVLLSDQMPAPGQSIFFIETMYHPDVNHPVRRLKLSPRQACAIESAARHNPNFQVFIMFVGSTYRAADNRDPLIEVVSSYANVHFRSLDIWSFAAGTPLESWLEKGDLFTSRYFFSHLSDFLRFMTLYRFGGIYLDMDVIVLRNLEHLPSNCVGAEDSESLNCAVIKIAATTKGHNIAKQFVYDLRKNFNGSMWANNGPGVVTRVTKKLCQTEDVPLMYLRLALCLGIKVFSPNAFYPVHWSKWRNFFDSDKLEETMFAIKYSYVAHLWNNLSKNETVTTTSNNAFRMIAEENCPRVYKSLGGVV